MVEKQFIKGNLYIVATPIGNLEDITLRALKVLKAADLIACEDTRRTRILTEKYAITKPLVSFYSHNQIKRLDYLLEKLRNGESIALVSDAGTPGISDPGYAIIRASIDNGINVESIPGPSALISALVSSGKPANKFVFEGFLSNKAGQRRKRLRELKNETRTIILYESPHRLLKLLNDIADILGDRDIVLARELTKKFEEIKRGRVRAAIEHFTNVPPKGEFVIIL